MRILHVSDCYAPRVGGIELHVRDLAERQRMAGHDVMVATRTPRDATGPDEAESGVLRIGSGHDGWLSSWIAEGAPAVVHAHASVISPFALATARRASRLGIPTVVTVHSLWTHVGPLPELARDIWGMRGWDLTWSAVSERAARPVREVLTKPVHVVPNAVDLDVWTPFDRVPVADPPHVLAVMRLTSVKRALPLARILARTAGQTALRATIVGDGPERGALERYLRRHRLTDRVRLTGALDRPAIRGLLEEASVFVAPAHRESFGIAALEARASGVPVVASARGGVATFVEHGRDGLLAKDDRGLASHLVRLLGDSDLREHLARHNRLVRPEFGWAEALERNEAVYAAAAAASGSRVGARATRGVLVG